MTEQAMFGAGCFWGVESAFAKQPGVLETAVGYSGGQTERPTYEDVCNHGTGHAEVVHVRFDPQQIAYEALVEFFFTMHNPTQLNRQGPDVGDQYRSAIFFYSPEQERIARAITQRAEQSGRFKQPVVTVIEPAPAFWRAEEYHQKYFDKRGGGSCHI
ncbi:MAG: peptide-methionine (S)-S-oxide reductase MsrA [Alphaproteobacteria bacterium]|nr:peptide-methionine (S)-S-oxide reductase MsrA [Alphaproteobacteria bacterium]